MIRILAHDVPHRLDDPVAHGFAMLRHEHHRALTTHPDFLSEFGKCRSIRQIDVGIRLATMAVSAGNHGNSGVAAEPGDARVLGPGSKTIEFESVDMGAV